ESEETTHFTVVDMEGNAVANTYTLNNSYGSATVAKGTGIILNDEMHDFAAKPGTPNLYGLIQGERNAVAPRKRPLSAMTPTLVLRKDGSLWFTVGSPGGPTIINIDISSISGRGDEISNGLFITTDKDILSDLLIPQVKHAIGGLEFDFLRNAPAIIYSRKDIPDDFNWSIYLDQLLSQVKM